MQACFKKYFKVRKYLFLYFLIFSSFGLSSEQTEVSYISNDEVFIVISSGAKDKFVDDSIVCFRKEAKKKSHACGFIVLASGKSAIVLSRKRGKGQVSKGDVGQLVKEIPSYLLDAKSRKKRRRKKKRKKKSGEFGPHQVIFLSENNSFAIISKKPQFNYTKGMNSCFVVKKKSLGCSQLKLVSEKYLVVPLNDDLSKKIKLGMSVKFEELSKEQLAQQSASSQTSGGQGTPPSGNLNKPGAKENEEGAKNGGAANRGASGANSADDERAKELEKEMQKNIAAYEEKMKSKDDLLKGLKAQNASLNESLNRKPVFMRAGPYFTVPFYSRFSFNTISYKTVGANQLDTSSVWTNEAPVTSQSLGLGGEVHVHWFNRWSWIIGGEYNEFPTVKRDTIADEFRSERVAKVQIDSESYNAYFGLLSRESELYGGLWEWGLYFDIERDLLALESLVDMPTENQKLLVGKLSSVIDILSLRMPLGWSWAYRRYLLNFQFHFIFPMAMTISELDAEVATGTLVTLTADGSEDLKNKIGITQNSMGFEMTFGVFL